MHLQQYDKNHCVYLASVACHSENSRRKCETMHVQHRIIYISIIYASS